MAYSPGMWGSRNNSTQYQLLLGNQVSPFLAPIDLAGYGLTSFSYTDDDPTKVPVQSFVNGRMRKKTLVTDPGQRLEVTADLLVPSGIESSPVLDIARAGNPNCKTKIYGDLKCAEGENGLTWLYQDTTFMREQRVNDFQVIDGTTVQADWKVPISTPDEYAIRELGVFLYATIPSDVPLYAIAFAPKDCVGCTSTYNTDLVAIGGAGGAADDVVIYVTDDRFSTYDTIDLAGITPVEHVGTCIYANDTVYFAGYATAADIATDLLGGTVFSPDSGVTNTISNITVPIHGVAFYNGEYIAVGGIGGGQAVIYTGENGIAMTSLSHSVLTALATEALSAVAVDDSNGNFFAVGEGGTLIKGDTIGGVIVLTDLSALLPGAPGQLNAVAVLGDNMVTVAGESGYYAESIDGGLTWREPSVPTNGSIYAVAGDEERTVLGYAAATAERSIQNLFEYEKNIPQNAYVQAGIVRGVASPDDWNYFATCADNGTITMFTPFTPNA